MTCLLKYLFAVYPKGLQSFTLYSKTGLDSFYLRICFCLLLPFHETWPHRLLNKYKISRHSVVAVDCFINQSFGDFCKEKVLSTNSQFSFSNKWICPVHLGDCVCTFMCTFLSRLNSLRRCKQFSNRFFLLKSRFKLLKLKFLRFHLNIAYRHIPDEHFVALIFTCTWFDYGKSQTTLPVHFCFMTRFLRIRAQKFNFFFFFFML